MAHENHTNKNLSELFAHARNETPVVSGEDINALLEEFDLHGRQEENSGFESGANQQNKRLLRRGIIMGTISTAVIAAIVGAGSLFNAGDATTTEVAPASHIDQPGVAALADAALHLPLPLIATTQDPIPAPTLVVPTAQRESASIAPQYPMAPLANRDDDESEDVAIDDEDLGEDLGRFIGDFWEEKINGYRRAIDRAVAGADLDQLNRLRIRWSLLEDEDRGPLDFRLNTFSARTNEDGTGIMNSMGLKNNGGRSIDVSADVQEMGDGNSTFTWNNDDFDNEVRVNVNISADADISEFEDFDAVALTREDGEMPELADGEEIEEEIITVIEIVDGKPVQKVQKVIRIGGDKSKTHIGNEKEVRVEIREAENEIHVARSEMTKALEVMGGMGDFNIGSMSDMLKMAITMDGSESSKIIASTWEIAERSRENLDPLKATIMEDLAAFEVELKGRLRSMAENSDLDFGDALDEDASLVTTTIATEILGPLYEVIAEPMLMLYNGSDITPVLTSAIAPPVPGMNLQASSTLAQSFPNPARENVTIEFNLAAPASGTVLRLYDVTGEEIEQRDLGGLPAGTHAEVIDVSNLPSGTYLYHLTVESEGGSRVYSKSLDVVR